jgi:hypothetical protein
MSDYLGMLAARYLNQAGSIRPEPVSVYQPPPPAWQLAVDSSPSDEIPFDEPGLPILPARPIAIDDGGGRPLAIDDGEGRPLFPSPSGGEQGGGALDVGAAPPIIGRAAVPTPGVEPGPGKPSPREPEVVAQPPGAKTVSVELAATAQPPSPDKLASPSLTEASSPSPFAEAFPIASSSGGGHDGGEPDVETSGQQPAAQARQVRASWITSGGEQGASAPDIRTAPPIAVERSPGPGQPVHPTPSPRVERSAPAPELASSRPDPPPEGGRRIDGLEPEVPALAPSDTPPPQEPGKTETPTPPVANSTRSLKGLRRTERSLRPFVHSLPLPLHEEQRIDARLPQLAPPETFGPRGRETKSDMQPIVEISIDEISIRAAPPPARATPRRQRLLHPPMSLEDYLRRRSAGVRR